MEQKELKQLVEEINQLGHQAELGDNTYLIRIGSKGGNGMNYALMHDGGLTWEPNKPHPTPCWGFPETAEEIVFLCRLADKNVLAFNNKGEGQGDKLLQLRISAPQRLQTILQSGD